LPRWSQSYTAETEPAIAPAGSLCYGSHASLDAAAPPDFHLELPDLRAGDDLNTAVYGRFETFNRDARTTTIPVILGTFYRDIKEIPRADFKPRSSDRRRRTPGLQGEARQAMSWFETSPLFQSYDGL